jgi:hypothetical protein
MWLQFRNKSNDAVPRRAPAPKANQAPRDMALSLAAIERLAPACHLKTAYPHVWERIWLFCRDPAHLEKYLLALSIQERAGHRAGLSPEAMAEVAAIRAANHPLLAAPARGKGWDAAWLMR